MRNKFTIGEMSKLHNTPVKTLRYYDELGLFKPIEIDRNNGYRYYSTEQFEQLNIINYLKALGLPLKNIKMQLEERNFDHFVHMLNKQKEITENKIKELELVKRRFENRIQELNQIKQCKEINVVTIKKLKKRKIVKLKETIFSEHELELSLRKLENMSTRVSSSFIGRVGLTVSMNNIIKTKFDEYNSVFIILEDDLVQNHELVETLPEGRYACIYFNGNHNESTQHYLSLLTHIGMNDLQISGDSIERTIIDQFISRDKDDYLTEIQIPVTPLTLQ